MWSNSNPILLEGLTTESTKKMISLATKRNTADKGSTRRIYRRDQHFNEARKRWGHHRNNKSVRIACTNLVGTLFFGENFRREEHCAEELV